MDVALHNDSSLIPIAMPPSIPIAMLFGFDEHPVVFSSADLIAWMRRARLSCFPTADVPFVTFQAGPNWPARVVATSYKEVEIWGALQLEHLQRKMKVFYQTAVLPLFPCWPAQCSCTPPHTVPELPWLLHSDWLSGSRGARWKGRSRLKLNLPTKNCLH